MAAVTIEDLEISKEGAAAIYDKHGRYYDSARRGRLFVATSPTGGIAIIAAAAGGGHPTLWNPAGNDRNLSVVSLALGYVSGNNAPGSLAWNHTLRAGAEPATGGRIPTATRVDVQSAMVGGPIDSSAIWAPTVNTFTAAPVFGRPIKLSLFTGVAATAVAPFAWGEDYDGTLNIAPGAAISLVNVAATTTSLFRVTVVFEEIDIE